MARVNLAHFRRAAIDHDAIARDPLGRGLFDGGGASRSDEDMSESERNEAWLRESLETVRGLPAPEAMAVVQEAREAFAYQRGTHHVVLDAVQEAVEARAAREAQEQVE